MIGVLLVTHGRLGAELAAAARVIQPDIQNLLEVCLDWNEEVEHARARIEAGLREVDRGEGAIILTDMFGGTPSNLSLPFLVKDRVEIVTGVNLPMVVKCAALQTSGMGVVEAAHILRDRGQRSIYVASDLLTQEAPAATPATEDDR
jgi:mannose PTS system EIIA component